MCCWGLKVSGGFKCFWFLPLGEMIQFDKYCSGLIDFLAGAYRDDDCKRWPFTLLNDEQGVATGWGLSTCQFFDRRLHYSCDLRIATLHRILLWTQEFMEQTSISWNVAGVLPLLRCGRRNNLHCICLVKFDSECQMSNEKGPLLVQGIQRITLMYYCTQLYSDCNEPL